MDSSASLLGILGALGVSWAPFWEVWGSLGLHFGRSGGHFGRSGGLLGSILGALGPLGLHFWSSGGLLAALWGPLGAPVFGQGLHGQFFTVFHGHFGTILGPFWRSKSSKKQGYFLIDFLL